MINSRLMAVGDYITYVGVGGGLRFARITGKRFSAESHHIGYQLQVIPGGGFFNLMSGDFDAGSGFKWVVEQDMHEGKGAQ